MDLGFTNYSILQQYRSLYSETIGNSLVVAAGLPDVMEAEEAARKIAHFALDLVEAASTFISSDGFKIQIRCGISAGPATAAVTGIRMPRYCVYGDVVRTAGTMEFTSPKMRVQISPSAAALIMLSSEFAFESRGVYDLKGEGIMELTLLSRTRLPPDFKALEREKLRTVSHYVATHLHVPKTETVKGANRGKQTTTQDSQFSGSKALSGKGSSGSSRKTTATTSIASDPAQALPRIKVESIREEA